MKSNLPQTAVTMLTASLLGTAVVTAVAERIGPFKIDEESVTNGLIREAVTAGLTREMNRRVTDIGEVANGL